MFDNLREEVSAKPFMDEEEAKFQPAAGTGARRSTRFLGMTAIQRFVLVFMLFMAVCVLGAMLLLLTGRMII